MHARGDARTHTHLRLTPTTSNATELTLCAEWHRSFGALRMGQVVAGVDYMM